MAHVVAQLAWYAKTLGMAMDIVGPSDVATIVQKFAHSS